MSANDVRPNPDQKQPKRAIRDLPGCIKYIILLFLLILFFGEYYAGEYRGFPRVSQIVWLILFIKLLLIILLLILIWVQRQLVCEITKPVDCAKEDRHPTTGNPRLTVEGTASGTVFGHYTLRLLGHPECAPTYPPGGGSTQVTGGVLGWIDTAPLSPGNYTVVLEVFPSGAGSSCRKDSAISILRAPVWIDKIGKVKARNVGPHPIDPGERLRLIKATPGVGSPETAIGGTVSIEGGAYLEGCGKRMFEYSLEYQEAPYGSTTPGTSPPEADAAAASWSPILSLQYDDVPQHPYTWSCDFLIGIPNFITNGILTRQWLQEECVDPLPGHTKYYTETDNPWGTGSLNGRYTVRVHEKHKPPTLPGPIEELFDAATVWVDNRPIRARIRKLKVNGGASLDVCGELVLSQFLPSRKADIIGHAWDPLILDAADAPVDLEPNDNFNSYSMSFKKDGGGTHAIALTSPTTPVPNIRQVAAPPDADTDVLATWNIIAALDAGPLPVPPDPVPDPGEKLYRGQRCAYIIYLSVSDKTHVSDDGPHPGSDEFPFCIVNDLPDNFV